MEDEIKMTPKGGNSPVRFFLYLNGEKIGMLYKVIYNKRYYCGDRCRYYWLVDVYNTKYQKQIRDFLHNNEKIERFYWGWIIWRKEKQH